MTHICLNQHTLHIHVASFLLVRTRMRLFHPSLRSFDFEILYNDRPEIGGLNRYDRDLALPRGMKLSPVLSISDAV